MLFGRRVPVAYRPNRLVPLTGLRHSPMALAASDYWRRELCALGTPRPPGCAPRPSHTPALAFAAASLICCTSARARRSLQAKWVLTGGMVAARVVASQTHGFHTDGCTCGPSRPKGHVMAAQGHRHHPAAASVGKRSGYKSTRTRLRTLSDLATRAARAPFAATTCTPSVPDESVGSRRPPGACPACTSPIFVRCASPPGTAHAPLSARLCPARAPRGSTRVEDTEATRGPRRPKGFVMAAQGHGEHQAAA